MIRGLLVMRHAKSDRGVAGPDQARPLKDRGRRAACGVGQLLARHDPPVERVLSSSARRARETAELVCEAGGLACPLEVRDELYLPARETLLGVLRRLGPERCVLLVGHEPSCSDLVAHLCGGAAPAFPTAALASVGLEVGWGELAGGVGCLDWLVTPRILGLRRSP